LKLFLPKGNVHFRFPSLTGSARPNWVIGKITGISIRKVNDEKNGYKLDIGQTYTELDAEITFTKH